MEVPVPMFSKFYFFDVLNPGLVVGRNEKPILEERGPYTFRQVRRLYHTALHYSDVIQGKFRGKST